jgi:hypothetical protein
MTEMKACLRLASRYRSATWSSNGISNPSPWEFYQAGRGAPTCLAQAREVLQAWPSSLKRPAACAMMAS